MRSIIYQISRAPIGKEDYVDVDNVYAGEFVSIDYVYELDDETRKEAITMLVNNILPKGLFTLNEDGCSLTYMGGLNKWKQNHVDRLIGIAKTLTPKNVLKYIGPLYDIQKSLINPLNTASIFVIGTEGNSGTAEKSGELMCMLDYLKVGDKIYIGEVFGYHI